MIDLLETPQQIEKEEKKSVFEWLGMFGYLAICVLNGSTGFIGFILVFLKCAHIISWSWLWVTAPIWIPLALELSGLILVVIFAVPLMAFSAVFQKKD